MKNLILFLALLWAGTGAWAQEKIERQAEEREPVEVRHYTENWISKGDSVEEITASTKEIYLPGVCWKKKPTNYIESISQGIGTKFALDIYDSETDFKAAYMDVCPLLTGDTLLLEPIDFNSRSFVYFGYIWKGPFIAPTRRFYLNHSKKVFIVDLIVDWYGILCGEQKICLQKPGLLPRYFTYVVPKIPEGYTPQAMVKYRFFEKYPGWELRVKQSNNSPNFFKR